MRFFRRDREKDTGLREAANVIADAVTAAKDEKIMQAEQELAAASLKTKESRVQLNLALRAARRLHEAIINAGSGLDAAARLLDEQRDRSRDE